MCGRGASPDCSKRGRPPGPSFRDLGGGGLRVVRRGTGSVAAWETRSLARIGGRWIANARSRANRIGGERRLTLHAIRRRPARLDRSVLAPRRTQRVAKPFREGRRRSWSRRSARGLSSRRSSRDHVRDGALVGTVAAGDRTGNRQDSVVRPRTIGDARPPKSPAPARVSKPPSAACYSRVGVRGADSGAHCVAGRAHLGRVANRSVQARCKRDRD